MGAVAQQGRFPLALTSQTGLGIHDATMCLFAAFLIMEVDRMNWANSTASLTGGVEHLYEIIKPDKPEHQIAIDFLHHNIEELTQLGRVIGLIRLYLKSAI